MSALDQLAGLWGTSALQQQMNAFAQQSVYNTGGWCTTTDGTVSQTIDFGSLLLGAARQEPEKKIAASLKHEDGPAVRWLDKRIDEMRVRL